MKVYIGDIVSVNRYDEVFRYLVEDAGKICYVGDVLPEKYASAERWILMAEHFCRHLSIPISILHHSPPSMPG